MLVFKIALIGIAGAMLAMVTKQFKPERDRYDDFGKHKA